MKHKEILSRAWGILWSYKVLWVFGIILALTTSSFPDRMWQSNGSGSSQESGDSQFQPGDDLGEEFQQGWQEMQNGFDEMGRELEKFFKNEISQEVGQTVVTLAVVGGCVIALLIILGIILRYVSESAIVQLVDEYEATETKSGVRQGFRKGFSRSAWQVFLINLVIDVPVFLAFVLLFLIVLSPSLLWFTENTVAGIIGTVAAVGLFFLVVFLAILVSAALSLLKRFFYRVCVLEGLGPIDAIKEGYQMVRANFKDAIIMWLILIGISIGFSIAMIPVALLLVVIALVIGSLLGLTVGGVSSIFAGDMQSLVAGLVAGVPIFLLFFIVPLGFLSGLKETYVSTSWTLAYREIKTLHNLDLEFDADEAPPELDDGSQA